MQLELLERLRPLSLLLIRIAAGAIFMAHGYDKYQRGIAATIQMMTHNKLPAFFGYMAIALELGGGTLLILGVLTRLLGMLLAIEMAIAIAAAHMGHGIRAIHSYEFPLALGAASLALGTFGAGRFSLDAMLWNRGLKARLRGNRV